MSPRDVVPVGAPCWIDLVSSDAARTHDFYGRLFGWTVDRLAAPVGAYVTFRRQGIQIAGCLSARPGMLTRDRWSVYLASDDARRTVALAVRHGGRVVVPAIDVGGLGTMAVVTDTDGTPAGVWQPGRLIGFGVIAEAGAPARFELPTADYAGTVDFYREVFRWECVAESGSHCGRRATLLVGGRALATIAEGRPDDGGRDRAAPGRATSDRATSDRAGPGHLPGGAPAPGWSVGFAVDDIGAALARVTRLGGAVLAEPAPNAAEAGGAGLVADPAGARFTLVGLAGCG